MFRTAFFIVLLSACANTITLEQALSGIVPSAPAQPDSPADSLLLVALSDAVVEGIPDFAPRRQVIIEKRDAVSPRMLPVVDSVKFFILDLTGIQKLANRVGSFTFLRLHSPKIFGDSAEVAIGSVWAYKQTGRAAGGLGGGACAWMFTKQSGTWARTRVLGCIIS
jgi:hypothetical protein